MAEWLISEFYSPRIGENHYCPDEKLYEVRDETHTRIGTGTTKLKALLNALETKDIILTGDIFGDWIN